MDVQGSLSVRDIKGKFEKLVPSDSLNSPSSQRRRRTPFSTIDPSPNENHTPSPEHVPKESKFLTKLHSRINHEPTDEEWTKRPSNNNNNFPLSYSDENREPFENEVRVDSRNRSYSVGSLLEVGNVNNETKPKLNSQTLLSRNKSFNEPNRKVKVKRNDEIPYPNYINSNNNFSSFSEKQKLVESIVMNIKNSRNFNKDNGSTSTSKHMTSATKEYNITSKFEKDLRNALEKGVRILGAKNTKDKCIINDRQVTNTEWSYKSKLETDDHFKSPFNNQRRSFSKINALLGEYIYPAKEKNKITECKQGNIKENKDHSGKEILANNKLNNPEINRCLAVESNVNEFNYDSGSMYETMLPLTHPQSVSSPLRPPRKRSPKKGKAPDPPLTPDEKIKNEVSFNSTEIHSSSVNDKSKDINISCQSLQNNSQIEYEGCNGHNSTTEDSAEEAYTQIEASHEDYIKRRRAMLEAIPPKKPPRTFAHDIYQCYKQESLDQAKSSCELSNKLTPEEIESLYTKPLKRNKGKKSEVPPTPCENKILLPKPAIAPKPIDIMAKARQRYSVVEPLSSSAKEFADHRPAVKRNSSFRFSFKMSKKSTISHPFRQVAAKSNSPVGRKFKQVARQWQHKKDDRSLNDKQFRFRPNSKSDEMLKKDDDKERIYAIPSNERITTKQQQPELHYMCSPLFDDNRVGNNTNVYQRERSPRERERTSDSEDSTNVKELEKNFQRNARGRFGIMDGLKEEWRQSYRFVQKRLKKGIPASARKL